MVAEYSRYTASEIVRRVRNAEFGAVELAECALKSAESEGRRLNAVVTICHDRARAQARTVAGIVSNNESIPPLAGVPIIIKDNIVCAGYPTTCGSRILEKFVPPYDATCVTRLEKAGAVIVAKANMDEFAMGSSNETSAFGPAKNPVRGDIVPGGSSGGSCAAVAAGVAPVALGSDTGGSVRQPAGFCGVVGLKPTYGAVSRYGLVAFASSTDQVGPIARTVEDCALVYSIIAGYDTRDATSVDVEHPDYGHALRQSHPRRYRFGIPKEYFGEGVDAEVRTVIRRMIYNLRSAGHTIIDISLPHTGVAIAAYYIIANAEASSNLARYDGVRYGLSRGREGGLKAAYQATRTVGFGTEVKRRIMLGTFALSAGYYDAYYTRALKARDIIRRDFEYSFESVDMILSPTSPTAAFRFGEKADDPLSMYLSDAFTVPASLAGIPAISVPSGTTSDGLPIGLQIMGPAFSECELFAAAREIEKITERNHADD